MLYFLYSLYIEKVLLLFSNILQKEKASIEKSIKAFLSSES